MIQVQYKYARWNTDIWGGISTHTNMNHICIAPKSHVCGYSTSVICIPPRIFVLHLNHICIAPKSYLYCTWILFVLHLNHICIPPRTEASLGTSYSKMSCHCPRWPVTFRGVPRNIILVLHLNHICISPRIEVSLRTSYSEVSCDCPRCRVQYK